MWENALCNNRQTLIVERSLGLPMPSFWPTATHAAQLGKSDANCNACCSTGQKRQQGKDRPYHCLDLRPYHCLDLSAFWVYKVPKADWMESAFWQDLGPKAPFGNSLCPYGKVEGNLGLTCNYNADPQSKERRCFCLGLNDSKSYKCPLPGASWQVPLGKCLVAGPFGKCLLAVPFGKWLLASALRQCLLASGFGKCLVAVPFGKCKCLLASGFWQQLANLHAWGQVPTWQS